jgi:hypothetical protein
MPAEVMSHSLAERPAVIDRLREQIRQVQAAPRQYLATLGTGVKAVDALGLFRLGGAVELTGEEASGRTSLALKLVASTCREKRLAAWVDGPAELYPPAAVPLGVELRRLLLVRPKAPGQLVWAAVQLLRSGAFTLVVLDVTHTGVRLTLNDSKKLTDAARAGGCLLVVLTAAAATAQGFTRIDLKHRVESHLRVVDPDGPGDDDVSLEVTRSSHGGMGKQLHLSRAGFSTIGPLRARRAERVGAEAAPGLAVPQVVTESSLRRPKKNVQRDGQGLHASRPGRDSPFELVASCE